MKHFVTPILLALSLSLPARAQHPEVIPGDLIIMLAPGAQAGDVCGDLRTLDGITTDLHVVKLLSAPMRAWLLHFDEVAVTQHRMLQAVRRHPKVMIAQNNHVVHERLA